MFQHHKISAGIMLLQIDEIGIGILRIRIQLILAQNPKNQFAQGRPISVIGRPQTQTALDVVQESRGSGRGSGKGGTILDILTN